MGVGTEDMKTGPSVAASDVRMKCWLCYDPITADGGFVQINPCKCTYCNYCFMMHLLKTNMEPDLECTTCFVPMHSIGICKYDVYYGKNIWNKFLVAVENNNYNNARTNRYFVIVENNNYEKDPIKEALASAQIEAIIKSRKKVAAGADRDTIPPLPQQQKHSSNQATTTTTAAPAAFIPGKPSALDYYNNGNNEKSKANTSLDKMNNNIENENKNSNESATSKNDDENNDENNTCNEKTPVKRKQCNTPESASKRNKISTSQTNELPVSTSDDKDKILKKTTDEYIAEMKTFKEKYGHLIVKFSENSNLALFGCHVRNGYRKITKEQRKGLIDIGFPWENDIMKKGRKKRCKRTFEERFRVLEKFKKDYGHCIVSQLIDNSCCEPYYFGLYSWLKKIRSGHTKITKEQREALNRIGFHWGKKSERDDNDWNEQYEKLKRFKERFGHTKIPYLWKEDKKFYNWCHTQRKKYNSNILRTDRKNKLIDIDFHWGSTRKIDKINNNNNNATKDNKKYTENDCNDSDTLSNNHDDDRDNARRNNENNYNDTDSSNSNDSD